MFLKNKKVKKELFGQIIKKGTIFSGSFFVFRCLINIESPSFAFVAPKSVSKKAVVRNKLKRRGYSIIRSLPIKNSQGVFFYKKNTTEISFIEIKKDVELLLKKARLV